jgi:hypothetical protein
MRGTGAALLIGVVASLACQQPKGPDQALAEERQRDQIRAAFLLYASGAAWRSRPPLRNFSCIQVEGRRDPSEGLLNLLSDRNLGLRKASACAFHGRALFEPISGSAAVLLYVSAIEATRAEVRVRGGYLFGRLDAAEFVCILERQNGTWVATHEVERVLS